MKVLFIVPSLRRAGAETQVIDLVNALDSDMCEKHLLSFEADLSQIDKIDRDSVEFHHVLRKSKYSISFLKKIATVVDENEIDIIHCTMQFSMLVAFIARVYSQRNPKIITVIHTTINKGIKEEVQDRLLYTFLLRSCSSAIFVCKNQMKHWINKFSHLKSKAVVIYNGIDTSAYDPVSHSASGTAFRQEYDIPDDAFVISCIAGFRSEKGHQYLINVFARLPDDVYLVLAGDGEMRQQIIQSINEKNVSDRVILTGNLSKVFSVLSASDITALSSTAVETFSIAMLESMSMSVPMIASDIGGLAEAIIPGETGALFECGNEDQMFDEILSVYNNPSQLRKMGVNARQRVIDQFSVKVMAEKTALLLRSLA